MGIEKETPVKIKIKSQKDGFNVVIKAKTLGTEAVPLTEAFIQELKSRGFSQMGEMPSDTEIKEPAKAVESSVPICPTHQKELVRRKGQFGDFWACPSKDENGEWCRWRPEKKKK